VRLLLSLREEVRKIDLHQREPGQFDPQVIRDIAAKVGMPSQLKGTTRLIAVAGGVVAGLGAVPVLGPAAAIGGGVIAVAGALWSGNLPRGISKVQWLKFAIEWRDLERQVR
jgi:hypothetical protein